MHSGKLIVIDGIDGSGKTTQINLFSKYLKEKDIDFEVISFPQYGKNIYADKIEEYLAGRLGNLDEVDPKKIAQLYADDRKQAKDLIKSWIDNGKLVISNRFISASKAHLGANITEDKREAFFKWLDELEYINNGLPKEDLTILLDIDPKVGQKNVLVKIRPDIHEYNLEHLKEARKIYLQLAKLNSNWLIINCMENGKMKSSRKVHQELIKVLDKAIEN